MPVSPARTSGCLDSYQALTELPTKEGHRPGDRGRRGRRPGSQGPPPAAPWPPRGGWSPRVRLLDDGQRAGRAQRPQSSRGPWGLARVRPAGRGRAGLPGAAPRAPRTPARPRTESSPRGDDLRGREGGQGAGRPAQTARPRADGCSQAPPRREPGPRVRTRPAGPRLCQKPRPAPPGALSARGAAAAAPGRPSGARQGPGRRPARGDPFPHKIPPGTRARGPGKGFGKTRTGAPTCKLSDRPPPPPPQNGFKPLRASRSPPAVQARAGSAGRGRPAAGHTPSRRCHGDARAPAAPPGRPGSGTSALAFPRPPTLGGVVMTTSGSLRSLQARFPAWRPLGQPPADTPRMTRQLSGHCCPRVSRPDRSPPHFRGCRERTDKERGKWGRRRIFTEGCARY